MNAIDHDSTRVTELSNQIDERIASIKRKHFYNDLVKWLEIESDLSALIAATAVSDHAEYRGAHRGVVALLNKFKGDN